MISVCLASYNGAQFIEQQVISVLSQISKGDELIIADDGSTDNTIDIVLAFKDARIKVITGIGNLGIVKNFEKALLEAKGEIIFLCDQDDVWLSGKVEVCVKALKNNLLVITDCIVVNEQLETLSPSFFELRNSGKGVLKNLWKNTYLGCCMAFRRDLLSVGLPMSKNIPMHDMWLGLLAQVYGNVLFINTQLSLYRRHKSAASPTGAVSNFGLCKQVKLRLILAWYLLYRILQTNIISFIKK